MTTRETSLNFFFLMHPLNYWVHRSLPIKGVFGCHGITEWEWKWEWEFTFEKVGTHGYGMHGINYGNMRK